MQITNCALSDLSPFIPSQVNPFDSKKALHLYRRAGFGANLQLVNETILLNPTAIANKIVDDAKNLPTATPPPWAKWTLMEYSQDEQERNVQIINQILDWIGVWMQEMKSNRLRDKMSLFWHNHFVTKIDKYNCPSWMYEYHRLLQKHALGNFKQFVKDIGKTPAMLIYLDGVQNTAFQPNENYARELFELFTLGVDNGYTQSDIVNAAKALSGWNGLDLNKLCGEVIFIPFLWDSSVKTIFGKSGNYGHDSLIDLLFQERPVQISEFICKKWYKYFVNPDVNEEIVKQMAEVFRNNNFEIAPVLKVLFASQHFYDKDNVGTVIPGHIEYFITILNELDYPHDAELMRFIFYGCTEYEQGLFSPVDVAGWPGNRNWITSNSYPFRSESVLNILLYFYNKDANSLNLLRQLAIAIAGGTTSDPAIVTRSITDYILPKGLQFESDYTEAVKVFKAEVPQNYFDSGQWNLYWEYAPLQVLILIHHLASLPEFQLK